MENLVLSGIGLAAIGYLIHVAWKGAKGEEICHCSGSGACSCCNAKRAPGIDIGKGRRS